MKFCLTLLLAVLVVCFPMPSVAVFCRELAETMADAITEDMDCAANATWVIKSKYKPKAACIGPWNLVVSYWYSLVTAATTYRKCLVERWPTECGEACAVNVTTSATTEMCLDNTQPYIELQKEIELCCSNLKACNYWMTSLKNKADTYSTQYDKYKKLADC